jgi:hypothetical protein
MYIKNNSYKYKYDKYKTKYVTLKKNLYGGGKNKLQETIKLFDNGLKILTKIIVNAKQICDSKEITPLRIKKITNNANIICHNMAELLIENTDVENTDVENTSNKIKLMAHSKRINLFEPFDTEYGKHKYSSIKCNSKIINFMKLILYKPFFLISLYMSQVFGPDIEQLIVGKILKYDIPFPSINLIHNNALTIYNNYTYINTLNNNTLNNNTLNNNTLNNNTLTNVEEMINLITQNDVLYNKKYNFSNDDILNNIYMSILYNVYKFILHSFNNYNKINDNYKLDKYYINFAEKNKNGPTTLL